MFKYYLHANGKVARIKVSDLYWGGTSFYLELFMMEEKLEVKSSTKTTH